MLTGSWWRISTRETKRATVRRPGNEDGGDVWAWQPSAASAARSWNTRRRRPPPAGDGVACRRCPSVIRGQGGGRTVRPVQADAPASALNACDGWTGSMWKRTISDVAMVAATAPRPGGGSLLARRRTNCRGGTGDFRRGTDGGKTRTPMQAHRQRAACYHRDSDDPLRMAAIAALAPGGMR